MGRPSNKEQRRAQIVTALLRVMSESGYEKASIQSIAKQAELSPGLVHYHFKNKQEILIELVEVIYAKAWQRYLEFSEGAISPKEKLTAFVDAALAFGDGADASAVAAWVVIGSESIRQEDVRIAYQKVVKQYLEELETLIHDFKQQSANDAETDAKALAAAVYGAIEGAFQLSCTAKEITPTNYAADTVKRMLFAVLG